MIKNKLRSLIYRKKFLFNFYYNYFYHPKNKLEKFLDKFSKTYRDEIFFIQIGANDGFINDPIYKFVRRDSWSGILIEPQKIPFERLKTNYSLCKNLSFENVAISEFTEIKNLYKLTFSDSRWATGLSSFKKHDIAKIIASGYVERMAKAEGINPPSNIEDWIVGEKVQCVTINYILNKYNVKNLDLLIIDTEGYDYQILKSFPLEEIKPKNIIYEHSHLSSKLQNESKRLLRNNNYKQLIETTSDTIAILE